MKKNENFATSTKYNFQEKSFAEIFKKKLAKSFLQKLLLFS